LIKVSVSGTLSTGKTEFVKALAEALTKRGLCVAVVAEAARQCPFPLDRDETLPAALWLAARIVTNELDACARRPQPDVVVCDRSVIDTCAYMELVCARHPDPDNLRQLVEAMGRSWSSTYAIAFLSLRDPREPIAPDGVRPIDREFQQSIEDAIIGVFGRFEREPFHLPVGLRPRVDAAISAIDKVLAERGR